MCFPTGGADYGELDEGLDEKFDDELAEELDDGLDEDLRDACVASLLTDVLHHRVGRKVCFRHHHKTYPAAGHPPPLYPPSSC